MPATITVDTGPLVALCDRHDEWHGRCVQVLRVSSRATRWLTTMAVVAEAMYLLARVPGGHVKLFDLLLSGAFVLDAGSPSTLPRLRQLMLQYADLPMDFADATVVELAERLGSDTVFTLDERDFRVYRPRHVPHLRLLPADL
jgi:predicted nucleic acid-binding protein